MVTPMCTAAEVAAILRVDEDTVYKACASGALSACRIGRNWRIHRLHVEAFVGAPIDWPT